MDWKLNESNFTWLDRLKICKFFLTPKNFWTMADQVRRYEDEVVKELRVDDSYAVFVSSGSTANTIVAMYLRDKVATKRRNTIVFPSTTWITSVSPFLREGFKPAFIDVNLTDLSMDLDSLEKYLKINKGKVACVFITSLLGFVPDMGRLLRIEKQYKVKIMMDNCENTLGQYRDKNISSYFTSTTSTYFGHQLQSVEGGFIFTKDSNERDYFLMARNHGMIRSLLSVPSYPNPSKTICFNDDVDARFDFNIMGNNFRNTNINAFIGLLDLARANDYFCNRRIMYDMFSKCLNRTWVKMPDMKCGPGYADVPFCIPLIFSTPELKSIAMNWCIENKIETRPIISGNLLRQTCLKGLDNPENFPNSERLHSNGFYVGLHNKVKKKDLLELAFRINDLKL